MENNKLVVFQEKQIRRVWHEEAWWFSIVDVVEVLTDTANPRRYWSDLKRKLEGEGFDELYEKIVQLKLTAPDGKFRATDCADTSTMFRIIQTIPSPKAEPFKRWLAQVGYERVQEIEDPELAAARARDLYRAKGYPEDWIEMRLKSIGTRHQLTSEWKARNVQEGKEYSILTAEIARATFGLTPSEHKEAKGLQRENLRDHMTNLELIFTMLGEETTRRNAIEDDAQDFEENKTAAKKGGRSAGKALKAYEKDTGKKVVSKQNFKKQIGGSEQADLFANTALPEPQTPEVSKEEAELLQKVKLGFSKDFWAEYKRLVKKRQSETISNHDLQRLIEMTQQVEAANARRMEYLVKLAQLRQVSLLQVMEQLGIKGGNYT